MNFPLAAPAWLPFEHVSSGPKAASAAASCLFSLGTLEIASTADAAVFALTERKQADNWRWALIGPNGVLLEEGFERTQWEAKLAAVDSLKLVDVQNLK